MVTLALGARLQAWARHDGGREWRRQRRRHHLYFTIYTSRCNGAESLERDVTLLERHATRIYDSNDNSNTTRAPLAAPPLIYFAGQDAVVARAKPVSLRGHAINARA
eukprot:scaffold145194_cov145-Phaeocystis_antarctica.AAC.2